MRFFWLALILVGCSSRSVTYEPQADREGIRAAMNRDQKKLRSCYEAAIDERPGAEGRVVLSWLIGLDGRAQNTQVVEAGPKISHIGPCLIGVINAVEFPKPASDEFVKVEAYPLFFNEKAEFGR